MDCGNIWLELESSINSNDKKTLYLRRRRTSRLCSQSCASLSPLWTLYIPPSYFVKEHTSTMCLIVWICLHSHNGVCSWMAVYLMYIKRFCIDVWNTVVSFWIDKKTTGLLVARADTFRLIQVMLSIKVFWNSWDEIEVWCELR